MYLIKIVCIPVTLGGSVNFKSCILRKINRKCRFTVINMNTKPAPMCKENVVKSIPCKT